jgi:hypothetical protein
MVQIRFEHAPKVLNAAFGSRLLPSQDSAHKTRHPEKWE